jgi:hypothetical protein
MEKTVKTPRTLRRSFPHEEKLLTHCGGVFLARKNLSHIVAEFSARGKTSHTLWRNFPREEKPLTHCGGIFLARKNL